MASKLRGKASLSLIHNSDHESVGVDDVGALVTHDRYKSNRNSLGSKSERDLFTPA